MVWGTIPDWLIAGAAVVYTVGTILLWRVTARALEATRDAFKLNFLIALHTIEKEPLSGAGDPRDILGRMNKH